MKKNATFEIMKKAYKMIMSLNVKYVLHIESLTSRELGDLKGIWQEQGPTLSAINFLSREGISLQVRDLYYSKCPGGVSNLFTIFTAESE